MSSPGQQVGFPQLDSHFVDEERNILYPWYRLLVALWQLTGSGLVPIFQAVFFKQISPQEIEVFATSPNSTVGFMRLKDQPGASAVALTPVVSPFLFTAPGDGTFVAFSCEIDLSRGVTTAKVSLTGGAVPMMKDDVVTLTWLGPAPAGTWFPSG